MLQTQAQFPPPYDPADHPNLDSIRARLESIHVPVVAHLQSLRDADLFRQIDTPWGASHRLVEMIDHLIEHEIHHRGELSLILGLLGRLGLDA